MSLYSKPLHRVPVSHVIGPVALFFLLGGIYGFVVAWIGTLHF